MAEKLNIDEITGPYAAEHDPVWFEKSKKLLKVYFELTEHIRKIAFDQKLVGFHAPNMSGWKKAKKILYWYSNPFAWFLNNSNIFSSLYFSFALTAIPLWFQIGESLVLSLFGVGKVSQSVSLPITDQIIGGIILILLIISLPATYIRLFYFLKDKRINNRRRFFTLLVDIFGLIFVVFYNLYFKTFGFSLVFLSENSKLPLLIFILFISIIPAIIYFSTLGFDVGFYVFGWFRSLLVNFYKLHDPLPYETLIKSLFLKTENSGLLASDLSAKEILTIKELAISNRDSTEKKITPTLVFTALIGLLVGIEPFNQMPKKIIPILYDWFLFMKSNTIIGIQKDNIILGTIIVTFGIVLILIMSKVYGGLFKNLFVQSLLIEICLYAEFGVEEKEKLSTPIKKEPLKELFNRFFKKDT